MAITINGAKVLAIRSNSNPSDGNQFVYIRLSTIYDNEISEGWARVKPDNEGARWIVNLAMEAKLHNLSCYVYGEHYGEGSSKRLSIYEFGLE